MLYTVDGKNSFKSFLSLSQRFPEGLGRLAGFAAEDSAEIQRIRIAHAGSNLSAGKGAGVEKLFGFGDADVREIFLRGNAGISFEASDQPADADVEGICVIPDLEGLLVGLVKLHDGLFHQFAAMPGGILLRLDLPDQQLQQLPGVEGAQGMAAGLFQLHLPDNPAEQQDKFTLESGSAETAVGKSGPARPAGRLTSGEMKPVYFRMVFPLIQIVLPFPGIIQDHMAFCEMEIFSADDKIRGAAGKIEKLEIISPGRADCLKTFPADQFITSRAVDGQIIPGVTGTCFIGVKIAGIINHWNHSPVKLFSCVSL